MESHIGIRFCAYAHTIRVGFYQRMNCFSAIYFASYLPIGGYKLLKTNSSFRPNVCKIKTKLLYILLILGPRQKKKTFIYILYYKFNFYRTLMFTNDYRLRHYP